MSHTKYAILYSTFLLQFNYASASGFQLFEQSGAGIGDYRSGVAAIAEDASTAYFNPAGLTHLHKKQVAISSVAIFTNAKFNGTTSVTDNLTNHLEPYNGTASTSSFNVLPAIQIASPLNDELTLALDIGVPFGLGTDWAIDSIVRNSATKSSIQVINVAASFGYQLNNYFSLGFGLDAQHLAGEFNLIGTLGGNPESDTKAINKVSSVGYGWHAGVLYDFTNNTRFGISYRSSVRHKAQGNSTLEGPLADTLPDFKTSKVTTDLLLPNGIIASAYHSFSPKLQIMSSIFLTHWSVIDQMSLKNSATPSGPTDVINTMNFKDTFTLALGLHYKPNYKWRITTGIGFDQTPTNKTDRDIRLPDTDRIPVSIGTRYQFTRDIRLDFGFMHLFSSKTKLNKTTDIPGTQVATAQGDISGNGNLVGLQYTWDY